jgi:hypothetical protein
MNQFMLSDAHTAQTSIKGKKVHHRRDDRHWPGDGRVARQ